MRNPREEKTKDQDVMSRMLADKHASRRELPVGAAMERKPKQRRQIPDIYDVMRRRICLLIYAPGTILKESELAREFGVSRTPIREVLHQLKFEGLVETRNGVGTFVTGIDIKSFIDAYELRIELAEMIGRLSPRQCGPREIALIEALQARTEALAEDFVAEDFWQINHELHHVIRSLIGNQELAMLYDHYYHKVARFWYQLAQDNWRREVELLVREFGELLVALRWGDMKAVANVHRNHISFCKIRIGQFIANGAR